MRRNSALHLVTEKSLLLAQSAGLLQQAAPTGYLGSSRLTLTRAPNVMPLERGSWPQGHTTVLNSQTSPNIPCVHVPGATQTSHVAAQHHSPNAAWRTSALRTSTSRPAPALDQLRPGPILSAQSARPGSLQSASRSSAAHLGLGSPGGRPAKSASSANSSQSRKVTRPS